MNNNEQPNYILKANEDVSMPKNDTKSKTLSWVKKTTLIIVAILIIGSFIFGDNLFSELSFSAKSLLIALIMGLFFTKTTEHVPSPFEIWFFDEYFVVYRLKRYYSKKVSRKEFNKFFYNDIEKCTYNNVTKRFDIIGKVDAYWYDYNKDGSVPTEPTYHRIVDGGICYFYTGMSQEIDFVKEVEEHSPIKIQIEK